MPVRHKSHALESKLGYTRLIKSGEMMISMLSLNYIHDTIYHSTQILFSSCPFCYFDYLICVDV